MVLFFVIWVDWPFEAINLAITQSGWTLGWWPSCTASYWTKQLCCGAKQVCWARLTFYSTPGLAGQHSVQVGLGFYRTLVSKTWLYRLAVSQRGLSTWFWQGPLANSLSECSVIFCDLCWLNRASVCITLTRTKMLDGEQITLCGFVQSILDLLREQQRLPDGVKSKYKALCQ